MSEGWQRFETNIFQYRCDSPGGPVLETVAKVLSRAGLGGEIKLILRLQRSTAGGADKWGMHGCFRSSENRLTWLSFRCWLIRELSAPVWKVFG